MLRARQRLDKYRIVRRRAVGGFATVYEALDTVEGIPVALKLPHAHLITKETLDDFRREVRVTARLDHPGIVPIKTAGFLGEHFVIVQPLGQASLADRLAKRIAPRKAIAWSEQLLEALAYAHSQRVIHCDVKPDNLLIFPGERLRLIDFGIAKVAQRTVLAGGGTGSVGFIAPEQAMGKPSLRSDVFSAALVIWRLLARELPEWPYRAPLPGAERIRKLHPELATLLARALSVDEQRRPRDARALLSAFRRLKPRLLAQLRRQGKAKQGARVSSRPVEPKKDWKAMRITDFRRRFGKVLALEHRCGECDGPIAESMRSCPWCGRDHTRHRGETKYPAQCPRCRRGVKLDWTYCAWCHGAAIGPLSARNYSDRRYASSCGHCKGDLMPFMRYCPWCRRKVTRAWPLPGTRDKCPRCACGVAAEHWEHCPWCARHLPRNRRRAH